MWISVSASILTVNELTARIWIVRQPSQQFIHVHSMNRCRVCTTHYLAVSLALAPTQLRPLVDNNEWVNFVYMHFCLQTVPFAVIQPSFYRDKRATKEWISSWSEQWIVSNCFLKINKYTIAGRISFSILHAASYEISARKLCMNGI